MDKQSITAHLGVSPSGRDDVLSYTWELPGGLFVLWTDPARLTREPPYWWGKAGVLALTFRPSPLAVPELLGTAETFDQFDSLLSLHRKG